MIDNALYYLGGSSTIELYPHQFYDNEHGEAVYGCSSDSCGGTRATKWVGRVGVMYSSDYTYATDLSICQKTGNYYNDLSCKDNNWLYLEVDEWTIAPRSDTGAHMVIVDSSGYVGLNGWEFCFAYHAGEVLPVVYLKSNVAIGLGEGTSEKPYTLVTK